MARIAILEDDELVRELLTEVLESRGHEVHAFALLEEAEAHVRTGLPDLLVTDVQLPDGSGLDLVVKLRTEWADAIPVLVLSGLEAESDFEAGFEAGATDYLTKPVSTAELTAKCSLLLSRTRRAEPARDQPGGELPGGAQRAFERYRIVQLLGQGSVGVVYEAFDLQDERSVALKVLSPLVGSQPGIRQRFYRESYSLSLVQHPNVVPVHDLGSSEGRLYYAMELVRGQTLAQYVAAQGPLSETQTIGLLAGLASALEALSAQDLVHRDLKPANIVLRDGRTDAPVLVDFGLAKRPFDRLLTNPGELVGTPAYMAPECVTGEVPGPQSDQFSLGLVARFALTGEQVFPEKQGLGLLQALVSERVAFPAGLSPELRAVLERLTQHDVAARYSSARDVCEALNRLRTSRHWLGAGV